MSNSTVPRTGLQIRSLVRKSGELEVSLAEVPVRYLSTGQKKRAALARVLGQAAPVWLLDEPFDALDVDGIQALNGLIAEHAGRGGCVLLTSHQPLSLTEPAPQMLDLEAYAPAPAAAPAAP